MPVGRHMRSATHPLYARKKKRQADLLFDALVTGPKLASELQLLGIPHMHAAIRELNKEVVAQGMRVVTKDVKYKSARAGTFVTERQSRLVKLTAKECTHDPDRDDRSQSPLDRAPVAP